MKLKAAAESFIALFLLVSGDSRLSQLIAVLLQQSPRLFCESATQHEQECSRLWNETVTLVHTILLFVDTALVREVKIPFVNKSQLSSL